MFPRSLGTSKTEPSQRYEITLNVSNLYISSFKSNGFPYKGVAFFIPSIAELFPTFRQDFFLFRSGLRMYHL